MEYLLTLSLREAVRAFCEAGIFGCTPESCRGCRHQGERAFNALLDYQEAKKNSPKSLDANIADKVNYIHGTNV